jgi:hypothetical protein
MTILDSKGRGSPLTERNYDQSKSEGHPHHRPIKRNILKGRIVFEIPTEITPACHDIEYPESVANATKALPGQVSLAGPDVQVIWEIETLDQIHLTFNAEDGIPHAVFTGDLTSSRSDQGIKGYIERGL